MQLLGGKSVGDPSLSLCRVGYVPAWQKCRQLLGRPKGCLPRVNIRSKGMCGRGNIVHKLLGWHIIE